MDLGSPIFSPGRKLHALISEDESVMQAEDAPLSDIERILLDVKGKAKRNKRALPLSPPVRSPNSTLAGSLTPRAIRKVVSSQDLLPKLNTLQ
jgi:hypothetical protein